MTWYAQALQDRWAYELIGAHGYFCDIGAYDGVEHSNTYALEQLGWTGICIEPDPDAYQLLLNSPRTCTMCRLAASDIFGFVTVMPAGIARPANRLDRILEQAKAPSVIDYLSIDTEGHELEVLRGMDFDHWSVRLITIEHNLYLDGPTRKDAIFETLTSHGFVRAVEDVVAPGYGAYEDWYVHTK